VAKHSPSAYYHNRLEAVIHSVTTGHARVLEIGSGNGDLLQRMNPELGVLVWIFPEKWFQNPNNEIRICISYRWMGIISLSGASLI
jgi:hypothetical protein